MDWTPVELLELPNQSQDPRIGSGRENATGGTLSHASNNAGDGNSSSVESLGSTFVPVLVFAGVCLLIFFTLRRKCPRVYTVRTFLGAETPEIPDDFILKNCSLDGFFFLRFIRVLITISFVGCLMTWPILLPIHATGGRDLTGLDMLTIGNVESKNKSYAHVVVSWIFFGFILYTVSRETIFYINLRQAYFLSPRQAHRLSSRTVLFTCVPHRFLDERRIRKLFGDTVKDVFIPRNTKILSNLVEEREQTAIRLENAEIELIKKANWARNKYLAAHPEEAAAIAAAEQAAADAAREQTEPISSQSSTGSPADSGIGNDDEDNSERSAPPKKKGFLPGTKIRILPRSLTGSTSSADSQGDNQQQSKNPFASPLSPSFWTSRIKRASSSAPVEDSGAYEKYDEDEYKHPYGLSADLADLRGSVAAQYIKAEDRPHHRPIANFGRRVDTIRWCRRRIRELNVQIGKLRHKHRNGKGNPVNAVFIEFDDQAAAQAAYQLLSHHQPLHMSPRFIGIRPRDVVWPVLRMRWWERIMRRFGIMGLIAAAVIFWSIPSAFVGIVSKVSFLTSHVPFLKWIDQLPKVIVGVIEGLLPAVALSLWMAAVPFMLRFCARSSGVPSRPMVELFTQSAYFVFQVVQVFLVTTLTSAASAALTDILANPLSIKDMLSQNLPKASNFYLSYILVQCLAGGAQNLVHTFELIRHQVIGRFVDNPRKRWNTWIRLKPVHWGSIFPVFTNLGVIAISYSCIAPLILGFAGLGMCVTYIVYRYNLIYNLDSDLDTKGLVYPRALMHLLVGLYLAEICMIGLFALNSSFVPLVLMAMFTVFTALVHISLNEALGPLMYNLPRSLALEDEDLIGEWREDENATAPAATDDDGVTGGGGAADYYNMEEGFGMEDDEDGDGVVHGPSTSRGGMPEGAKGLMGSVTDWVKGAASKKFQEEADESGLSRISAKLSKWMTPDRNKKPNFMTRWLHPEIYEDFLFLREKYFAVPKEEDEKDAGGQAGGDGEEDNNESNDKANVVDEGLRKAMEEQHFRRRGYYPPEMWLPAPKIWVPRDPARVSRQEVGHSRGIVEATDRGIWINPKADRVVIGDLAQAPYEDPRLYTHLI
ncbi:uncharacterized protein E0L32_002079 [Thyridium curvatum]|uniref:Uncharacterized protein n=1 Tax=Thyridium curvatum TaxID=1093900 RepID=A0A507ALU5_9PEZI|nr:uncharacterized protein E0L32_002054 [Thyridium curvatum]XP_030989187.1 uncharacterized protein E0L32_002079 [Thyridium curvatum]TPX07451.1 hypothetical protein E0L32_002054 [Thyridium curvatum]TPX07476.1 hypothetical protein E0L32_002079 [Thyridium curvatum]